MFRPSRAPITFAILAVITIVFVFELLNGALTDERVLVGMGAIIPDSIEQGQSWRLLAAMFLHASWLHWALNCFALLQLGTLYETMFGSVRFTFMYFATGLIASAASSQFSHANSVGASGAIFGILGAFIFSIRRSPQWRHQPWTRGLLNQLIFWAVINIGIGFSVRFIDNTAHLAGLFSGLLLGLVLPHRVQQPPPPSERVVDVMPYDD